MEVNKTNLVLSPKKYNEKKSINYKHVMVEKSSNLIRAQGEKTKNYKNWNY